MEMAIGGRRDVRSDVTSKKSTHRYGRTDWYRLEGWHEEAQFEREAMGRLREDEEKPLREVAHELGIRPALLSKLKTEYLAENPKAPEAAQLPPDTEVKRLLQKVAGCGRSGTS